jgi:hypothetical protein
MTGVAKTIKVRRLLVQDQSPGRNGATPIGFVFLPWADETCTQVPISQDVNSLHHLASISISFRVFGGLIPPESGTAAVTMRTIGMAAIIVARLVLSQSPP